MSDESADDEMARLFAACRSEQPVASVRRTVLVRARHTSSRRSPWLGAPLVLVAACALLALGLRARRAPAPNIGAERLSSVSSHAVEAVVAPKQEPVTEPEPSVSTRAASAKSAPKPAPPSPLTLEEETSALERVRASLHAGEPSAALAELDAYQKAARGGNLALEATLLRIQALSAAGRTREASELAQRFVVSNPNSPLVDRARRYISLSVTGESQASGTNGMNGRNQ